MPPDRCDILIGLPSFDGSYPHRMWICLEKAVRRLNDHGYTIHPHRAIGSNVALNRCLTVEHARKVGARWIWYVDADVMVPPWALENLKKRDRLLISGVYVGKQPPYNIIASRINGTGAYQPIKEWPENGVLDDLDGVGAGCMLVKMEVFDKLDAAASTAKGAKAVQVGAGRPYFQFSPVGNEKGDLLGEDYHFCRSAKAAGIPVSLDTSVCCRHIGDYEYSVDDHIAYRQYNGGSADES